ncbi:MAG TPA: extracellular solute-binding protein, partial [Bacteroidota bacterium]|nr:extracellular solute-binding protein [Bacteroidota bacterium]
MMRPLRLASLAACVLLVIPGCPRRNAGDPGVVTITFWHSFVASTIPALDDLIQEFERTHPGIRVRAQYIPTGDGLIQKLITSVQSNTAPDVSWIHADFLDRLAGGGALIPMQQFIDGTDSLPASELNDIFPSLLDAGRLRGVLYTMPMEATSLALLYNRGLFREAGLDPDHPPKDWDELKEYASRLTSPADDRGRRER